MINLDGNNRLALSESLLTGEPTFLAATLDFHQIFAARVPLTSA